MRFYPLMTLATIPSQLKKAGLVLMAIPLLVMLQIAFFYKIPWWKVNWTYFETWVPIASVLTFVLWVALVRGSRYVLWLFFILAVLWTVGSGVMAWATDSAVLAISAVSLAIFWYFYIDHIDQVLSLPYLDPGLHWYQGLPEPIPGLIADLTCGNTEPQRGLKISKLSTAGVFVTAKKINWDRKNQPSELTLHYKGKKITCPTLLISWVARPSLGKADAEFQGLGLQFKNQDRDFLKELSDFVELLRGEGHVI